MTMETLPRQQRPRRPSAASRRAATGVVVTSGPTRCFVHRDCGARTEVQGPGFQSLADPYNLRSRAYCGNCQRWAALPDLLWEDTGEDLSAYRGRVRSRAPRGVKVMCAVVPILTGLLGLGAWLSLGAAPPEVGIFTGGALWLGTSLFLVPPLARACWRVDFRSMR